METIKAEMRDPAAKAKQLRRSGIIPCVISGAELMHSVSIQMDQGTARQLRRTSRAGSKVDIQVGEKTYHTLMKDLEYNSLNDSIVHISFHILNAGKKVNSVADIVLLNKNKIQGVLEQMQMKIPHAAEPEYLLDTVSVDLDGLPNGTVFTVGDIPEFQSEKIELQVDPANLVFRISEKKRFDPRTPGSDAETEE